MKRLEMQNFVQTTFKNGVKIALKFHILKIIMIIMILILQTNIYLWQKIVNYVKNKFFRFLLSTECYLLSSGWVESTLTKKPIPILYLPWWDASNKSRICNHPLKFISDCQKWCSSCS